jgi:hypothetical protein
VDFEGINAIISLAGGSERRCVFDDRERLMGLDALNSRCHGP